MMDINFAKEDSVSEIKELEIETYKILVIDDEQAIHDVTALALSGMNFINFKIEILHALSAKEAETILQKQKHKDIALALVDVVMETPTAGLDLVEKIRNEYKNEFIRLVIRTGQANDIPAMDVIQRYDIDDYKEKTELTIEKLYTTIRNSIRQYRQLMQLQNKYEETYYQMTHNALTKLPNRIQLQTDCEYVKDKTLILIDIVGFSVINDTNGFQIGDMVLKELGAFLYSMYSNEFNVYHLDGDLFALITLKENPTNFFAHIEKIKEDISKLLIVANNFNQTIDTTIGVAYQSEDNLMRKAELALKEARNDGKNSIKFYSDDLKIIQRIENTNLWRKRIKDAINDDRIKAYYQPIVDFQTKEVLKYESLVRLEYNGKIYSPYHFLNAAKYSGQLYDIFKIMLTKSCQKIQEKHCCLSVNVADTDLLQDGFLEFVERTVTLFGISKGSLSFEILEHSAITDDKKLILNSLSDSGFEILVDDFGVQCSSFGQLASLCVSTLKIDGSFIKDIATNENNQIIVKSIMYFAKEKGLKVVAEFVCDEKIYNFTKKLGIDYAQGYYFSEPRADIN